ncbi:organic hydroperoxide resistance protein [Hazenella sp. IB182357]|uniref:Organic hydroperoxide resistance protein n=1 Tax=Polycladospora coralii TaxID=2771432 RepID=A0A926N611_9BACL|nr:organic hydroperoxide resistance protein [Polycladospora coralii]MBD1371486.1 organic hydroperoxide resistance protein [Polycladospora coralii]MBS7530454.1 organic hydroperoxide resistance protein [Polycladospora coralii]
MKKIYTATVTATGGRNGKVVSDDGILNLEVKMPKAMQGPGGPATNPEQLFAAGYSACFDSALNLVLRKERQKVESTEVTADVSLNLGEDGGYTLSAELKVKIVGLDKEKAQEFADKAHQVCPYSRATRGNIPVEITIID